MEFLIANKNDSVIRRVCRHFPCVYAIEISESEL